MSLPTPNLDDRRFQDIVDEAKRLIPRYCPEWTDHNVSDPGVTLIELFAWMVEMMLYRLNRVPEKSYIAFMELMGVQLQAPAAAQTDLTFWLSAPPTEPLTIPAGIEAATVQTTTASAVSFSTDAELVVRPPTLQACLTSPDEQSFSDQTRILSLDDQAFSAFSANPKPGESFYLGYAEDLSNHILALLIDCKENAARGLDPKNPPLTWEAWCGDGWGRAEAAGDDETEGLNKKGHIMLHLPPSMTLREFGGKQCYWVRCRHAPQPTRRPYSEPPQIMAIEATTRGGTVSATHAATVVAEVLGRSNGMPGQSFRLEYPPILPRRTGETVEVEATAGTWQPWVECEHFGASRPSDTHFVLDNITGEIRFGPSIREPDGSERQYGAIPPRDRQIRFSRYRTGGGAVGNVGTGTLKVLKSSVPYVDTVENRRPAIGGRDAESLEHAKLRAPQMLRTRFRAVTAEDYEYLAAEASSRVARARCLQPGDVGSSDAPPPGVVRVLLVPTVNQPEGYIPAEQLTLPHDVRTQVQRYLDERRLLTTKVELAQPDYHWVSVRARLKARPEADQTTVERDASARLYRFLNPLVGGSDGSGWTFGRSLYISEVYAILQGVPGVEYIEQVNMLDHNTIDQTRITITASGLIASAQHQITVV